MNRQEEGLSPALLAGQRQLEQLRAQHQARRASTDKSIDASANSSTDPVDDGRQGHVSPQAAEKTRRPDAFAARIQTMPAHLGWASTAVTAVVRAAQSRHPQTAQQRNAQAPGWLPPEKQQAASASPVGHHAVAFDPKDTVKVYPDIALGLLRQEQAAAGRLWLLSRYLDAQGSGAIRIVNLRERLTGKSSPMRICGWRQLRNLLRQGDGVFWARDKKRLWLRSAANVAYALGVERLAGQPVALPLTALLDGIGAFRANLYVAFHSGRTKETRHGIQVMPIARETLAGLSGVGRASQRAYEKQVGVQVQANFAVGEVATRENQENRAWTQGQALFELKDYRGQQGKKGKTYLAWQLPNTYIGQHQQRPRGRQKRINRKLKDLVMKGMPGNVGATNEPAVPDGTGVPNGTGKPEKMYYPNGKLAAKAYGRDPERELYWKRHRARNGRFDLWQQLGCR